MQLVIAGVLTMGRCFGLETIWNWLRQLFLLLFLVFILRGFDDTKAKVVW